MRSLIFVACAVCTLNHAFGQEHGIINTSRSPHVKLRSIDIGDCRWTEGFWADKFKLCEQVMVPHMGTLLKGDVGHAYDNFKIVAGLKEGEHRGTNWHDGDFYKWESEKVSGTVSSPKGLVRLDFGHGKTETSSRWWIGLPRSEPCQRADDDLRGRRGLRGFRAGARRGRGTYANAAVGVLRVTQPLAPGNLAARRRGAVPVYVPG